MSGPADDTEMAENAGDTGDYPRTTPDSLPVLGEVPGRPGLFLAFGHGHFGMTGGPPSARLVAQIVNGERPGIDPAPYACTRFS